MTHMLIRPTLLGLLLAWAGFTAQAQALRPSLRLGLGSNPVALDQTLRQADYIVAVVNSEPITNHDVRQRVLRTEQQLNEQGRPLPPVAELTTQVLERMINERAQMQHAKETGIRIDGAMLDQAEQNVASQNQLDVTELRRRLLLDGIPYQQFREDLRTQLTLGRLRERDLEPRIKISDGEADQFLDEQRSAAAAQPALINLAQILIAVPDEANAAQVAPLKAKAERAWSRARSGEDFSRLVREFSDARGQPDGELGLRPADRYPSLFSDAVKGLKAGELAPLQRSDAGFHILKLLERREQGGVPSSITQNRSRHILLRPNAQMSETAARSRLSDFKAQIESGRADFAALAKANSQDGSAREGGDLGWANPGQFVPEFEEVLSRLNPGQIAPPIVSRFGVHLIQLLERREAPLSARQLREVARAQLKEKRLDEAYVDWARDIRARAYVEMREPPQ